MIHHGLRILGMMLLLGLSGCATDLLVSQEVESSNRKEEIEKQVKQQEKQVEERLQKIQKELEEKKEEVEQ